MVANEDSGEARYVWSIYCEKPVSEESRLKAIEHLFHGMARVIALKHVDEYCHICVGAKDSGFPPTDDKLGKRLIKAGVPIVGSATVYKGDEAVLFTLEVSVT